MILQSFALERAGETGFLPWMIVACVFHGDILVD